MKEAFEATIQSLGYKYGMLQMKTLDQTILQRFVWPLVSKYTLAHDSHLCKKYKDSETKAFPTERMQGVGNFVGSVIETGGSMSFTEEFECPKDCRPPDHQDWIYC